jgi:hypothetical protein
VIDCNEWKIEKRHECTTIWKVKRLELWRQLYVTWLPVRELENFKPLDFCWTDATRKDQLSTQLDLEVCFVKHTNRFICSSNIDSMDVNVNCPNTDPQWNEVSETLLEASYEILNVIRSVPMFQINLNTSESSHASVDIYLPNYTHQEMSNSF